MQGNRNSELLRQISELYARAADLREAGQKAEAESLERQADGLRRAGRRAAERSERTPTGGGGAIADRSVSVRELTVATLGEIGVPASPRLVGEYARLRFHQQIEARYMASLRRDEFRAWEATQRPAHERRNVSGRSVYVVPALEGRRFLPVHGKVALSDWPLERRIVGPWSERADLLRATLNVGRQIAWLSKSEALELDAATEFLSSLASTIPGATKASMHSAKESGKVRGFSTVSLQIASAAQAELDAIAPNDEQWRKEAAERAADQLDEQQQLWGFEVPYLVRTRGA